MEKRRRGLTQQDQHNFGRAHAPQNQLRVADTVPLVHSVYFDGVETVIIERP